MKLHYLAAIAIATATLNGCAVVASPSVGFLYTDVHGPVTVGAAKGTTKVGQACVENFVGLISTGDASIDAAKKAGNITNVSSVDHASKIILGVYGQYCTVVKGE